MPYIRFDRWPQWARCFCCGGPLVAIGHARKGGADHCDWDWRKYHKKCWKEYKSTMYGE